MRDSHKIQWTRFAVEGSVIVASILLAFAIDAWWDTRVERKRERQVLLALVDDLATTRTSLVDGIGFHTAVRDSNKRLLAAVTSSENPLSEVEFDHLLLDLSWWDSTDPFTTGTLNSVIFSGDLAIISNHGIRRLVADLPTKIALVEGNRRQDYEFFWNIWAPILRQKGLTAQISEIDASAPGRSKAKNPVAGLAVRDRKSMSSTIADEEFYNVLLQKLWVQNDNIVQFTNMITHIDYLTTQIHAELGDVN